MSFSLEITWFLPSLVFCSFFLPLTLVLSWFCQVYHYFWSILRLGGSLFFCIMHHFLFHFWFLKQLFNTFQVFSLSFVIGHCKCLTFGSGIVKTGSLLNGLYGISTTHALWSLINYHSGENIAVWQSISFVAHITPIWCLPLKCVYSIFTLVLSSTKSHIPNCMRNLDNLPLFRSLLSSIINMIL